MNEEILNFSQAHAEPEWLQERRQKAFEQIEKLELPVIERVRLNRWKLDEFKLVEPEENNSVPSFTELPSHPLLVQVGSQTVVEQITPELAEKGLIFTDFANALQEIPEIIKEYLGSVIVDNANSLSAINMASFNSAVVLYIPDHLEVDEPIENILIQDGQSDTPFYKRVLIIAGKNSKINYLERLQSTNEAKEKVKANLLVEVLAKAGAQVKFSALDELGANVTGYISRHGLVGDNATIDWSIAVMNDGNIVEDFDSELRGNGSHSNIKAVGISTKKQTQIVNTQVTNYGNNSVGHIHQNGVIVDRGTLTFNGIGQIIKGAKFADAQQESRVLMLTDKGRGDANPILLIDENEVTAGHAASVGQIDEEDLFYLQSRGLSEEHAKRLVIRGFLASVVSEIPVKSVRQEFIQMIERKLGL